MISQIGIKNIIECFKNVEVKEFNQKFTDLYKKLSEKYSCKEICNLMPFLYNNIEKVTNLQDNITLDDLESIKFESENTNQEINIKVVKEDKGQNYEWLDTTSIVNLLWGYILASVAEKNLDVNEDVRKVLTYHIKDEEGLIVATARAYYSSSEKYLLFNSLTLSQSFINKGYSVEKIKSLIIDYVLAGIEDIINFFNKEEVIISKVNVGISEKSIKEQIANRGTKIISEKI